MLAAGLAVTHIRLGAEPREIWKDDPAISRAKISSLDHQHGKRLLQHQVILHWFRVVADLAPNANLNSRPQVHIVNKQCMRYLSLKEVNCSGSILFALFTRE